MSSLLRSQSKRYVMQSSILAAALSLLTFGVAYFMKDGISLLTAPVVVSFGFTVVSSLIIALTWRWVAEKHEDNLTTFYSAVSGFRMLAALATLTVCYFCVGRSAMVPYVVVFMVFYFAELAHHSLYFSHITNNN